jgi:hypothetical protein
VLYFNRVFESSNRLTRKSFHVYTTCPPVDYNSFTELVGFDPNDPKGEKAAKAEAEAAKLAAAKKKKAAGAADLDDLLNAGLSKGKKGKK